MNVAGVTSTYSKHPQNFPATYPQTLAYAYGPYVWDTNGKRYVDWSGCLGANILGHRHEKITMAIRNQLMEGIVFPLPTRIEEIAANTIGKLTGTEQVRFCKNGSDATEAAVRLARHVTGKSLILTTGYHGSHSDLVAATPRKSGGVLGANIWNVKTAPSADALITWLRQGNVAAVLAEPIFVDGTIWPWEKILAVCRDVGALLIFDEVITGFRYHPGPAYPVVTPDLYCFGKAIANGMPLACVAGPAARMSSFEEQVFFSSTAAAECLSLAACIATLDAMETESSHHHIWEVGQALMDGWEALTKESPFIVDPAKIDMNELQREMRPGRIIQVADDSAIKSVHPFASAPSLIGLPPRTQFRFSSDEQRNAFLAGMCARGHLLTRDNFITAAHDVEHVNDFLTHAMEVLREK